MNNLSNSVELRPYGLGKLHVPKHGKGSFSEASKETIAPVRLIVVGEGILTSLRFGNIEQLVSPIPTQLLPPDDRENPELVESEGPLPLKLDVLRAGQPYEVEIENDTDHDVTYHVVLYGSTLL